MCNFFSLDDCRLNGDGCLYNGDCQDGVDSYTCKCVSGFSGRHCQTTRDLCSGTPCSNGGCVNNYANATHKCFCDYPYLLGKSCFSENDNSVNEVGSFVFG